MNLKAKLYILKNHTLLLLGPSPFEHWLESYLYITEGSVLFSEIAFRSSIVFLGSLISCASARARDPPPPAASRAPAALHHPDPAPRVALPLLPSPHRLRCPPFALPRRAVDPERLPHHTIEHAGAARHPELGP
jgi:hypothetical protein